jgi:uncharacterized membrane protein YfcA
MKRIYGVFLLIVGIYFLYTAQRTTRPEPAPTTEPQAVPALPSGGTAQVQVQRPPELS